MPRPIDPSSSYKISIHAYSSHRYASTQPACIDTLPQNLEVIVYTLEGHMPVYYRSFSGNVPDSRSLSVILEDLRQANFKDVVLVTDRGYESIRSFEVKPVL